MTEAKKEEFEQQKDNPKPKKKKEKEHSRKLVYFEKEGVLSQPPVTVCPEGHKIIELQYSQRSIGVINGVVKEFDPKKSQGKIEVDGNIFPFSDELYPSRRRKIKFLDLIGKKNLFSFWPTWKSFPKEKTKETTAVTHLKVFNVRDPKDSPLSGTVEVIGKLEEIWDGGFVVCIWSFTTRRFFYVVFTDNYPVPEHLGNYVWVIGRFEPKTGQIHFVESSLITFVPEEKIEKFGLIEDQSDEQGLENLWSELKKETPRTMVNAKLKIVLREMPKTIKETGKTVCIPLENQPKPAPSFIELSNTSIDLLISKKMWKNAEKKASDLQEKNQTTPVRIIEALIGLRENKLVAVASSIQIMPGKSDKEKPKIEAK